MSYKLPPLPSNCGFADAFERFPTYTAKHMQDYARAAIEANRAAVPAGYALISVDALKAWGKFDLVNESCSYATATAPQPVAQPGEPPKPMTAHRAAFFMYRFLHEEKLLGPNEQAALRFAIAALESV